MSGALITMTSVNARSDNSLSNLLGLANLDMFLNLEQTSTADQALNDSSETSNAVASNLLTTN